MKPNTAHRITSCVLAIALVLSIVTIIAPDRPHFEVNSIIGVVMLLMAYATTSVMVLAQD